MEIDFTKIIAVSGVDDLFELSNSQKDNVFLISLKTGQVAVYSMNRNKVLNLSHIQVYTKDGMIDLSKVLLALRQTELSVPSIEVDKKQLQDFFVGLLPNIDTQKVYPNSMKQIIKWHYILLPYTFTHLDNLMK